MDIGVVAFEALHERLRHSVGLGTADRSEAGNQAQAHGELDRLVGSVAAAVVGEPLDRLRRDAVSKALLDGLEHQVSDHLAADAADAGTPGNDFPITGIQRKGDTYDLAVPTGDLEAIRGPS